MQWTRIKSLLFITNFFAFFLIASSVNAQSNEGKFKAGLKAGMNTSQMTGDAASGFYKFSLVAGAFANYRFNENLKFQYELLYQEKGSNNPAKPDKGINTSYKIRLNYIQVPLLFQYDLGKFEIELGPGLAFLLASKEWDQNGVRSSASSPYDWRTFELDAMLGVNYEIQKDHLFVNVRSHHSITSIISNTNQIPGTQRIGAWNIVLALTLNYQF